MGCRVPKSSVVDCFNGIPTLGDIVGVGVELRTRGVPTVPIEEVEESDAMMGRIIVQRIITKLKRVIFEVKKVKK